MDTKLEKLNFLGSYLSASRSEDEILEMTMLISKDVLGFDHAILRLLTGDKLISRKWYGFPREAADLIIKVGEGVTGLAVEQGHSVKVDDTAADDHFLAGVENCRSELCVPIIYNEAPIGAINVESDEPNFFTARDVILLETLASQVATSLNARKLEGELAKAEKLSLVGQMASSILHDIRNDIHQLNVASYLLKGDQLDRAKLDRVADMVKRSGDGIYSLIEDIFEYVRTGETKLARMELNLSLLLDAVVERIRAQAPENVTLTLDADPSITLALDQRRFERVMLNLANNAIEAMPEGGELSISAHRTADGAIHIMVRDTGCGVPPELAEKIWEPLFTHGKKQGTGLGMAIIRKIVEEHGFTISLTSTPGEGTTFTIVAS